MEAKEKRAGIQSIERACSVLDLLDGQGEMGVSEIGRALALERSTVHRIVSTLKNLGYLVQNQDNAKYALSFRFFEMGSTVVKRHGLRQQGAPFLRDLSVKTGEAVNLAILDGDGVIYIDKIESRSTIKVDLAVGKRMPAYCTGLGKVLLAWMPGEKVREILSPFPLRRFTPNTMVTFDALEEDLRAVRRRGYSVDDEEYVEGLVCIAAPIRGRTGAVVAAMSVAIPKFLYAEAEEKRERALALLMEASERFSLSLGFPGEAEG